nr:hypothetical protein B0A51_02466 [Rachicladosporium sp. CCFEE 5018]
MDSDNFETLSLLIFRTSISTCALAACFVTYRLYAMFERRGSIDADDGMVAASMAFLIVITVIGCEASRHGFGYHAADIAKAGGNRQKALLYFWLFQIFYKIVICLNKLACRTLYLHLFPQVSIRRICWATIAVVSTGTLAFVLATTLECFPISKNWLKNDRGHCINNTAFRWSWAGFNTATDPWVVLLPMPIIYRLQMSTLKRVGASVIFALGLFIVAVSAIRMSALQQSVSKSDTTWDSAPAFIWSHVEATVGLIATCLPALKKPLSKLLPKRVTGTAGSSTVSAHKMRPFPPSGGGSFANRERNAVQVSAALENRESQERILLRDHGIMVTKDVEVQTTDWS